MTGKGIRGGSYNPLSQEEVEKIHDTSLKVLEDVGVEINEERALKLFQKHGAKVEGNIVKIPRDLVMEKIKTAPSSVKLCGREEKHDLVLEDKRVYIGTGGTALRILNSKTGEVKPSKLEDIKDTARLVDSLQNIKFFMLPLHPHDVPKEDIDVNRFFTGLKYTSKHVMGGVYTVDGIRNVIRIAEIISGSAEELRKRPIISMITLMMSPLKLDREYGKLMIEVASSGIPLVCPTEPICGSTAPITLAGNLVLQNAETLTGVILTQLVNPGTPVICGCVSSTSDLRDMKYLSGSIEMGLLNAAAAQMAQFYKLPCYVTAGMSDSKAIDAQCVYESAMTSLLVALAGGNYIHDAAGMLEFALTNSLEKYVIDNEILGMVMRAVRGIKVNEETLALEVIKKVKPGGNFVANPHTIKYMRGEHYLPMLSNRDNRKKWEADGRKDTTQRAIEKVHEILKTQKPFPFPEGVEKRILAEIPGIKKV
jgi:trimethylamine--corrinoid protein Co-methyltransferase